jgi:hypothetical protein
MERGTNTDGFDSVRPDQPVDDAAYRRIDLYCMLDADRRSAKITAVSYLDRGQLVDHRVVLPCVRLDLALATALDLIREHFPSFGAPELPFE